MTKRLTLAYRVLGLKTEAETLRECRKDVKRRLKILPPTQGAARMELAARDLLLNRCRRCGNCWMARL